MKQKTREIICVKWMKEFKYDPISLLKKIGVVEHEETCEKLVRILLNADQEYLSKILPRTEFQLYWEELEAAGAGLLIQSKKIEIDLTKLFYVRVKCQNISSTGRNTTVDDMLTAILPDVPTLCEQFELHAMVLMKIMVDGEHSRITQNEEELTCVCDNLLQLFEYVDLEEGSRAHLKETMKKMLASVLTPEDLVEGCVQALHRVMGNREDLFWEAVVDITENLDSKSIEGEVDLDEAVILRILAIIAVVCEVSTSELRKAVEIQERFYALVHPPLSHDNQLVREAAVGCLGRLGVFVEPKTFDDQYEGVMVKLATSELEPIAIRIQSLFALTDWVILSLPPTSGILESLKQIVPELLEDLETKVVRIAAEVALRLLFSKKVPVDDWIAKLLVLFFDPVLSADSDTIEEDSEESISDVGSPERLQQLLSLFFPTFCIRGETERGAFLDSVSTILALYLEKDKQKRKRRVRATPISKVLDYVVSTANGTVSSEVSTAEAHIPSGPDTDPGPSFRVALQLAEFISQEMDVCSLSLLRSLCKHLGKMELDIESGKHSSHTSRLGDTLEELASELNDQACVESIQTLHEYISNLEMSEQETNNRGVVEIPEEETNNNGFVDAMDRPPLLEEEDSGESPNSGIEDTARSKTEPVLTDAEKENGFSMRSPRATRSKRKKSRENGQLTPLLSL